MSLHYLSGLEDSLGRNRAARKQKRAAKRTARKN